MEGAAGRGVLPGSSAASLPGWGAGRGAGRAAGHSAALPAVDYGVLGLGDGDSGGTVGEGGGVISGIGGGVGSGPPPAG
jgi:hypothetical protein